jgi:hypothetical protein
MNLHRVRRLAGTLVSSQLRSGRSGSNPRSFFGRTEVIALADVALFLFGWGGGEALVRSLPLTTEQLSLLVDAAAPLFPLVAIAAVLVAGVMFELTTTSKFSGSDAANWLPITPAEYVAASSSAIAYTYSPAIALLLGALLPVAEAGRALPVYGLAAALSALALWEGAVLVEMVRATTQRASSVASGRRGSATFVLRALLLIVLILAFNLAFNPVFLLGFLQQFSSFRILTAVIPVFWSTQALAEWVGGAPYLGAAFAFAQVGFVVVLVYLAGWLRVRFWVPAPTEVRLAAPAPRRGHPFLAALGLSRPEAAIVSKDLRGFVRRREMLPTLVVPVVLVVLLFLEGGTIGRLGSVLWVGWVAGFFALLLAVTSLGQERRSLQSLYAYPITARAILRAKATSVFLPSLVAAVAMSLVVGALFGFSTLAYFGLVLANTAAVVVLTLWGLVFAARFSDFQDRPRPQFLRPGAMLGAMASGMVLLFAILLPASFAFLNPSPSTAVLALEAATFAVGVGALALYWARAGFDRLFRELPF